MILDAEDVDPRELETFGRVQRQQVDAIGRQLDAFGCRERHAFEQQIDRFLQRSFTHERIEPGDGGGITLRGIALRPQLCHQSAAAQARYDLVERGSIVGS